MRKTVVFALTVILASCGLTGSTPSQTFLTDAGKAVTILQALDSDAAALGAPVALTTAIGFALTTIETADTDLANGKTTPAAFSTLLTDEINNLSPVLLANFKSNSNITTGVLLAQQLVLLIAGEITTPTTTPPVTAATMSPDLRDQIDTWLHSQH